MFASLKMHMLKPSPHVMIFGGGSLGGDWIMKLEPLNEISIFTRDPRNLVHPIHHVRAQ